MRLVRLRNLRLFWKLLLPFVTLLLLLGVAGTFLVVRDLAHRAEDALDRDLFSRSVDVEAFFRDQELYLLDSVRLMANIEGIAAAVDTADTETVAELLESVLALRTELALMVVADEAGIGLMEIERGPDRRAGGGRWEAAPIVAQVLAGADARGDKRTGFLDAAGGTMLATASPIRSGDRIVGAAVAGVQLDRVVTEAARRTGAGLRLYGRDGLVLASAGEPAEQPAMAPPTTRFDGSVRRTERTNGGRETAVLYYPLVIRDETAGMLATSLPAGPAKAAVRGAGLRLTLILAGAMVLVVLVGALLTRTMLAQLRPLVETNRRLGSGDLSARTPVLAGDELGEVARGVNQMAEQLQTSYSELESRVEQRTLELRRLYDDVKDAAEARTQFFAQMAHEFRTPLFAILGHAEMMRDPSFALRGPAWRREFGDTIKTSSQHLLTLINEILDLAKFEAGRMELSMTKTSPAEILIEARPTIESLARDGSLDVEFDVPDGLPAVRADRTRLKEVILNLASNAVKYTPAGGRVRVSASAADGWVTVSVWDNGVGIPPGIGDRIFEPFFQVEGTSTQRGEASTGLGLALVKRLADAHGGNVSYASVPHEGTTFLLSLPAVTRKRRGAPPRPEYSASR